MTEFTQLVTTEKPTQVLPISVGKFGAILVEYRGGTHKAVFKARSHETTLFRGIPREDMHIREVLAYDLDQFLGFSMVPETVIGRLNGREGSFQMFVTNAVLPYQLMAGVFNKKLEDWKWRRDKFRSMLDVKSVARMIIFDMIIGNVDRHGRNAMFTVGDRRAIAIDNGCAFGRYMRLYRNSFHKYLFMYQFPQMDDIFEQLQTVTMDNLVDVVGTRLPPNAIRFMYWRMRLVLKKRKNLSFKEMSEGHYRRDEFPAYKDYFNHHMKTGRAPKGPLPIVYSEDLYMKKDAPKPESVVTEPEEGHAAVV